MMEKISRVVVRVIGVLNLIFAILGFLFMGMSLLGYGLRQAKIKALPFYSPYLGVFYIIFTVINLFFLIGLCITGVQLLKQAKKAIFLSSLLFICEVAYFFLLRFIGSSNIISNQQVSKGICGATGIGNMGLSMQLITYYPVIALVLLIIIKAGTKGVQEIQTQSKGTV
jgi:hypothetical protein